MIFPSKSASKKDRPRLWGATVTGKDATLFRDSILFRDCFERVSSEADDFVAQIGQLSWRNTRTGVDNEVARSSSEANMKRLSTPLIPLVA